MDERLKGLGEDKRAEIAEAVDKCMKTLAKKTGYPVEDAKITFNSGMRTWIKANWSEGYIEVHKETEISESAVELWSELAQGER